MHFFTTASATVLLTFTLNLPSYALTLPSTESVQGIISLCAAGRSVEVQANLNASLQKWIAGASGEGNASISEIGAIIKLTKDDKIRVEALSIYHSCLKTFIPIFIENEKKSGDTINTTEVIDNSKKTTNTGGQTVNINGPIKNQVTMEENKGSMNFN